MPFNIETYKNLQSAFSTNQLSIIAVSKTKPVSDIMQAYEAGVRDFGENYVQELIEKETQLPSDIRWHFIGHLQSNKVKYIAPFVHLIQGVDSEKLLLEINKQAAKNNRIIDCLLQIHIATEESKFGFDEKELEDLIVKYFMNQQVSLKHVRIIGLMGMASFSDDKQLVKKEFSSLKKLFDTYATIQYPLFKMQILSMGMSSDANIAVNEGSNMIRIGSSLFGSRS